MHWASLQLDSASLTWLCCDSVGPRYTAVVAILTNESPAAGSTARLHLQQRVVWQDTIVNSLPPHVFSLVAMSTFVSAGGSEGGYGAWQL